MNDEVEKKSKIATVRWCSRHCRICSVAVLRLGITYGLCWRDFTDFSLHPSASPILHILSLGAIKLLKLQYSVRYFQISLFPLVPTTLLCRRSLEKVCPVWPGSRGRQRSSLSPRATLKGTKITAETNVTIASVSI